MADYGSVDGVRALLPTVPFDDSTTKVKLASVQTWVTQATNAVNVAWVAGGGSLPITGTDTLGALAMLCDGWVSYRALAAAEVVEDPKLVPLAKKWVKDFDDAIALMREGGWSAGTEAEVPWSYSMDFEPGQSDPEMLGPKIKRDQEW